MAVSQPDRRNCPLLPQDRLLPINHMMVVRKDVAEREPWVGLNILKAFNRANDIAEAERLEQVEYHLSTGCCPAMPANRSFAMALPPIARQSRRSRNTRWNRA